MTLFSTQQTIELHQHAISLSEGSSEIVESGANQPLLSAVKLFDVMPQTAKLSTVLTPLFKVVDDSWKAAGVLVDGSDRYYLMLETSEVIALPIGKVVSSTVNRNLPMIAAIFTVSCLIPFFVSGFVYSSLRRWLKGTRMRGEQLALVAGVPAASVNSLEFPVLLNAAMERLKARLDNHRNELANVESEDRLTGLANRQQFQFALQRELKVHQDRNGTMALLFIDLDGFKQVNDTHGHSAGDALLVQVAHRLKAATRSADFVSNTPLEQEHLSNTLARLGGDEFTVILRDLKNLDDAELVADRIIRELEKSFSIANQSVSVSASIGISLFPRDGKSPEVLVQKADVAMYQAKSDGKGVFRNYMPEMGRTVARHSYLSNELRSAIERSQFSLQFQPIVSLKSSQVSYFEALLRWDHPEEGDISPGEFIPIAEETNQILPISDWVLKESLQQMREWFEAGMRKTCVSVNISGEQLTNLNLFEWVANALEESTLPARCLMLEIRETYLMNATGKVIDQLKKVRELGVRIAIDDFGTGFSSLSMLASLPIDIIKIDRSFVNQASTSEKYCQILMSIMQLAKELDLTIIAEGVETENELALLKRMDCHLVQGFLVSKPKKPVQLQHEIFHQKTNQIAAVGTSIWQI